MSPAAALPWRHALLGLAVVAVWGSNFVVIKQALTALPPLALAVLRFALAFLPAALLLKRPPVPWPVLARYGLFIGAGQFGLLYSAMDGHITPGLASLVVQSQVFLTIALAMVAQGERPLPFQWVALVLAGGGIAFIAAMAAWQGEAELSPLGVGLVLLAALSWAAGNHTARAAGRVDMLAFVVWSSVFALPPLAVLSLWLEGPARIAEGFDEGEAGFGPGRQTGRDFVEIAAVAGREIVQPGHRLAGMKQGLDQMGTDETGRAGHQPASRRGGQRGLQRRRKGGRNGHAGLTDAIR